MKRIIFSILIIASFNLNAQTDLNDLRRELNVIEQNRQNNIKRYLENHPETKTKIYNQDGEIAGVLINVIGKKPIYRFNDNRNAANATRTNFLEVGGDLNLNLEGENMEIGVWEVGGIPLPSHVEFNQTGTSRIQTNGDESSNSYHATHVGGTIGAAGIQALAQGMAPKSILVSYNSNNDLNEALIEASNGMLISNHSYGVPVVSQSGTSPTWLMGNYNTSARAWDQIINLYDTYLPVYSAGNDGQSNYNGGLSFGFDKLTGEKNSKNNLVIANASNISVDSNGNFISATINPSSSQGPTDDGRIKPDITGLGTNILSTSNQSNTSYGGSTGTSMSAPNVAGTLLLVQELYNNTNNTYLKAATLKALAINTADDAGVIGPDPVFGWGVLNAKFMADIILSEEYLIDEQTLANNETISFEVTADDLGEIRATLVWSDEPGTQRDGQTNISTPALVNDLDLRIIKNEQNITFFPWMLDQSNLTGAALKGDNVVDNVERIDIQNTVAGDIYTIEISHKGSLVGGSEDYGLIISGISDVNLNNNNFNKESISVWPNPVRNQLNITSLSSFENEVKVSVFDMSGRLVKSRTEQSTSAIKLDTSNLTKGVYLVNISDGQNSIQKKIIKE
ncbi:S8 family serine peptidase [Psychroflexus sp. ALD_RP9]|uniref:S8 family serine peptidase n=1 Tax=Psychroflexus sp. ALD_RP9 TaxID=2777186 RepID=UPI001A8F4C68|nr:S8 family serine peptidase [Psychroflexus sp. ALD_RP9]QSS97758.1 S8 family serine peptidase [Psychroflexus sp. ALD_RP9]